jgi:hypothetical protein
MPSRLLRGRGRLAVDFLQDSIASTLEEALPYTFSKMLRICTGFFLAQHLRSVRSRDDSYQVHFAVARFGIRANRHLASAA